MSQLWAGRRCAWLTKRPSMERSFWCELDVQILSADWDHQLPGSSSPTASLPPWHSLSGLSAKMLCMSRPQVPQRAFCNVMTHSRTFHKNLLFGRITFCWVPWHWRTGFTVQHFQSPCPFLAFTLYSPAGKLTGAQVCIFPKHASWQRGSPLFGNLLFPQ